MRKTLMNLAVGSLLVFGTTACADLDITNFNDPDAAQSLATPGDVLSLIGGSYNNVFYANYDYYSAGLAISNAGFQHTAPWGNAGMEKYGRIPRIAFINSIADPDYNYLTRPWFYSYRAIAAVSDGLKALDNPDVSGALSAADVEKTRAFGKFVQGLAHGTIAVLFSEGFIVDETTDLTQPQEPVGYDELMAKALGYLEEAATLSAGKSWSIPASWMTVDVPASTLARLAKSWKVELGAAVARTPAERAALNWTQIMADADAGITSDFFMVYDWNTGWEQAVLELGTYYGWAQMTYYIYGMADQSGNYQTWNAASLTNKSYNIGGKDILIVTPDNRFPQGTSVEAQRAAKGRYFRITADYEEGEVWARPDRGQWRWSWYNVDRQDDYAMDGNFDQEEFRVTQLKLLKAEGLFRKGDKAGAAAIINETRVASGLNATDANGTNTSCVPKLPNGQCGDLFEMLKWEYRMENTFKGPLANGWYFHARGWGDLYKDTFLQLPIPCGEAQVLQFTCVNNFGGAGGESAAALSTYKWNGEG